eukprot:Cvel_19431.t1-p1 / transcript=Cvel_19431.t1 / gene=Cvel_19431 / organism=Chromera_velia_CCMP2878 / gene_product=hypothetical protein / transcript_product=hypothetical protein / location=Cvel_scaffold1674:31-7079(-) / protein_length=821 / sequence_SO=supercontig / SO=protein_coding / is_pseudo=false
MPRKKNKNANAAAAAPAAPQPAPASSPEPVSSSPEPVQAKPSSSKAPPKSPISDDSKPANNHAGVNGDIHSDDDDDGAKNGVPAGLNKNARRRLKNKAAKQEERQAAEIREQRRLKDLEEIKKYDIGDDALHKERQEALTAAKKSLSSIPPLSKMTPGQVLKNFGEQKRTMDGIVRGLESLAQDHASKVKKPDNKNLTSETLIQHIRDLESSPDTDLREEQRAEHLSHQRAQVTICLQLESFKKFQQDVAELKRQVEARMKENSGEMEKAKEWEKGVRMLRRVAEVKGLKVDDLPREVQPKTITVDLSPEIASVLSELQSAARRLERQLGVVIEKPPTTGPGAVQGKSNRTLIVTGFDGDASAAVSHLRKLDFSGKTTIPVDSKTASAIIGKGGSNVKKIEADFGVFVATNANQVTFYGPKAQVETALKFVQLQVDDQTSNQDVTVRTPIARALLSQQGAPVREIEKGSHTMVTIQKSSTEQTKIVMRGRREDIQKAIGLLKDFEGKQTLKEIPREKAVIAKLFPAGGRPEGEGKSPPPSGGFRLHVEYQMLRDATPTVTFLRKDDRIVLVGPGPAVKEVQPQVEALLEKAGFSTLRIQLQREHIRLFSEENRALIEAQSGAAISMSRRQGDKPPILEVHGSDDAKAKAKAIIDKRMETEGHFDTSSISETAIDAMLRQRGAKVREIEGAHSVTISIDKKARTVKVTGAKEGVANAMKKVKALEDQKEETLQVEGAQRALVLGPKGTTIRTLRNIRGVDRVGLDEESLVVTIRGSAEGVEKCMAKLKEILEKGKDLPPPEEGEGTAPPRGSGESVSEWVAL